jgi:hypothetical protein
VLLSTLAAIVSDWRLRSSRFIKGMKLLTQKNGMSGA